MKVGPFRRDPVALGGDGRELSFHGGGGNAIVGGLAGGLGGHLWKGMSRADVMELGEALDSGDAALLVIGSPALREQTERILSGARRRVVKQLDVKHGEFAAELAAAEREAAAQRPTV